MNFSLKRQRVNAHAREVASLYYAKMGYNSPTLAAIIEITASDEAFLKYSPDQPRVPAGNGRESGRWTDGSGEASTTEPEYPDAITPVYPIESALVSLLGGNAVVNLARRILATVHTLREITQTDNNTDIDFTDHGTRRYVERCISENDIHEALQTAKKMGQITTQIGKYGTPQNIYKGSNGITVVIETAGRNAGKIITLYPEK